MNFLGAGRNINLDGAGSKKNKKKTKIFLIFTAFILISMTVASLILGD